MRKPEGFFGCPHGDMCVSTINLARCLNRTNHRLTRSDDTGRRVTADATSRVQSAEWMSADAKSQGEEQVL
jgi:hypothetical protein